jgi:hypothetical protein
MNILMNILKKWGYFNPIFLKINPLFDLNYIYHNHIKTLRKYGDQLYLSTIPIWCGECVLSKNIFLSNFIIDLINEFTPISLFVNLFITE